MGMKKQNNHRPITLYKDVGTAKGRHRTLTYLSFTLMARIASGRPPAILFGDSRFSFSVEISKKPEFQKKKTPQR